VSYMDVAAASSARPSLPLQVHLNNADDRRTRITDDE